MTLSRAGAPALGFYRGLKGFRFVCGAFDCFCCFCPISSFAPLVRMVASSSFNPTFKWDVCLVSQSGTGNGDCARTTRLFFCLVLTVRENRCVNCKFCSGKTGMIFTQTMIKVSRYTNLSVLSHSCSHMPRFFSQETRAAGSAPSFCYLLSGQESSLQPAEGPPLSPLYCPPAMQTLGHILQVNSSSI